VHLLCRYPHSAAFLASKTANQKQRTMPSILDPQNPSFPLFSYILTGLVLLVAIMMIGFMNNAIKTPPAPQGWGTYNYDSLKLSRASYFTDFSNNTNIPIIKFQVATANFGGIITEQTGAMNPYIGSVSPDAARMQVEAGARAIIFDIWPDPAAPANPVVAAMLDNQQWWFQNWWANTGGLGKGTGRYSNWRLMTRNTAPVGDVLGAAINAAFNDTNSKQSSDPFFVVLKLHGAMTIPYLNTLGTIVQSALGGHAMEVSTWGNAKNQAAMSTSPASQFLTRAFVTVIPDIETGYNSLPNINNYKDFVAQFQTTTLASYTNAIEQYPNTMFFDPTNTAAISSDAVKSAMVVVQPSIGGQSTDNTDLFAGTSYTICRNTGAQLVAVNLFSPNAGDATMTSFFDPAVFGKYSFILNQ
jgi:hypothetical protein